MQINTTRLFPTLPGGQQRAAASRFSIVKGLADHVLALHLSDESDSLPIGEALQTFETTLQDKERISYYIELDNPASASLPFVLKDIRYSLRHIQRITSLHRVAVVSDNNLIQTLTGWQDKLFRFVEIQAFPTSQLELARQWVGAAPRKPAPSLTALPLPPVAKSSPVPVVALRLDGKIRKEDVGVFEKAIGTHRELRLLIDFQCFDGLSSKIFTVASAELKLEAMSKTKRYAFVNPPAVAAAIMRSLDGMIPTVDIRTFKDLDTAWVWISV